METKEQHYVPKFYLRRFSMRGNSKTIGLFNTSNQLFITRAPLKSQACKPYYYGHDGILEGAFSTLEGMAAEKLREISATLRAPIPYASDGDALLAFIMALELRTPSASQRVISMTNALRNLVFDGEEKLPKNIDQLQPNADEAIKLPLTLLHTAVAHCSDLRMSILKNRTRQPFITSDNPVVKYNQFLEYRKTTGGITGYGQIGLQLFLSIDAETVLLLYDSWVYKVGAKHAAVVDITDAREVDALNILSFLNCGKVVYFDHQASQEYLTTLYQQAAKYGKPSASTGQKFYSIAKTNTYEEFGPIEPEQKGDMLLHMYHPAIKMKLALSFISLTRQARRWKANGASYYKRTGCRAPDPTIRSGPFTFKY